MDERISSIGLSMWPREFQGIFSDMPGDKRTVYSNGIAGKKRKTEAEQIEKNYVNLDDMDDQGNEVFISKPPPLEEASPPSPLERRESGEGENIYDLPSSFNFNSEDENDESRIIQKKENNEQNIYKNDCFLCEWYGSPKDIDSGPVYKLLMMIREMLFKGKSDLDHIYNQASIYYNNKIYKPAMKAKKFLPYMDTAKFKSHFEVDLRHNPAIFTFISIRKWLKVRDILLNKAFYKKQSEDGDVGEILYPDIDNIKTARMAQQQLDSLFKNNLDKLAFGSENVPDLKNTGYFINNGMKDRNSYDDIWDNRDD